MDGPFVSMDHLPARKTREEAQAVVDRINKIREESNVKHEEWVYTGTGSAFTAPRKYYEFLTIKEID